MPPKASPRITRHLLDSRKALEAIAALDRRVGGDPSLDLRRATVHGQAGLAAQANECLDRAVKREPTLAAAWRMRLEVALRRKDDDRVRSSLEGLEKLIPGAAAELESQPNFADLVQSEAYKQWKNARKKE